MSNLGSNNRFWYGFFLYFQCPNFDHTRIFFFLVWICIFKSSMYFLYLTIHFNHFFLIFCFFFLSGRAIQVEPLYQLVDFLFWWFLWKCQFSFYYSSLVCFLVICTFIIQLFFFLIYVCFSFWFSSIHPWN